MTEPLRRGLKLPVLCAALDDEGAGLALVGSDRVHVHGALADEEVVVEIEHVSPHRRQGDGQDAWGRLLDIGRPSPARVEPACPAHGLCGGCPLQHLAYPAQLAWKRDQVLKAFAAVPALAGAQVAPCVPSPRPLHYRNQAKYVCAPAPGGGLRLGAYAPRSHEVVDQAGCRILESPLDEVAQALRNLLAEEAVAPFDERLRTGTLRYVVLRTNAAGEVLATLVVARDQLPAGPRLAGALRRLRPEVVGVVLNINPSAGNAIFGAEERLLDGVATIEDRIGTVRVRLSSRAFFQINRHVAALAYERIQAAFPAEAAALEAVDAYAGAGGIALHLAQAVRRVTAIESNAAATREASETAKLNGVTNVRFLTDDAARGLQSIESADLVVLNPPRSGCARAVIESVLRLRPRLLAYLSCSPRTLARDLGFLIPGGYALRETVPFDMLPHTLHVETLAILERVAR